DADFGDEPFYSPAPRVRCFLTGPEEHYWADALGRWVFCVRFGLLGCFGIRRLVSLRRWFLVLCKPIAPIGIGLISVMKDRSGVEVVTVTREVIPFLSNVGFGLV